MTWFYDPQIWLSLLTLTFLEIVLGIDNVIVISILAGKVEAARQATARRLGILFALVTRVLLLFSLSWLAGLTSTLFSIGGHGFSGRDLVLIVGGLFLLVKSTQEIHHSLEGGDEGAAIAGKARATMAAVVFQIAVVDIIFSLDSVITAIGIAQHLWVMVTAVVISMFIMLWLAGPISDFVHRHPTVKMLALSFLILIGFMLVIDGFGQHVPKGYIYFAMGFSLMVELLNMRLRKKGEPVHLHERSEELSEELEREKSEAVSHGS